MIEEWKQVIGFPDYDISNLGRVRSWKITGRNKRFSNPKILVSRTPHHGHSYHILLPPRAPGWAGRYSKGQKVKQSTIKVATMVLEAFVGPRPDGMQACHNDGNPRNDSLDNLRWDTPRANYDDNIRLGTFKGEKNGRSVLTISDVKAIRSECDKGVSSTLLGKRYSVSPGQIRRIARREQWTEFE